jgi:hypothetical protein
LYDQYGTRLFSNLKNISVSLDNTVVTALTDSTGKYLFSGLKTGSYSLTITDSLYGTNKVQDIQFVGGGDLNRDLKLSQIPTFTLSTFLAIDTIQTAINYVKVEGTVAADSSARRFVVFAGASSNVSSDPATYRLFYFAQITPNSTSFSLLIPASELYGAGLIAGDIVYLAAYPAALNFNTTSSYEDFTTGNLVFTSIGSTPLPANTLVP